MSDSEPRDLGREALSTICTADFFRQEYVRFREIMCSTAYSIEQKENAFRGLTMVYLNVPDDSCETIWGSLVNEFSRRMTYETFRKVSADVRRGTEEQYDGGD